MEKTVYLSESEKKTGRHAMYMFEAFNGVSMAVLGDTFVFIIAGYFMASNFSNGYISSVYYLAGIFAPFFPLFFKNRNVIKVETFCWLMRGFVCLGYLSLFFLTGKAAVFVTLAVYTLFCTFRSFGVIVNDFAVKSITSKFNRASLIAGVSVTYNVVLMLSKLSASFAIKIPALAGLTGIVIMQMVGVVGNTAASLEVSRIPSRAKVTGADSISECFEDVFGHFKSALRDSKVFNRLLIKWIFIGDTVLVSMAVPFMSKELMLSSSMVILYSVVVGFAVVLAGLFSKKLAAKIGSKPLLMLAGGLLALGCFAWMLLPTRFGFIVFFFIGFVLNFAINLINLQANRLVSDVIPESSAMSFNSMVNFFMAIFASLMGACSAFLISMGDGYFGLETSFVSFGNDYSFCFAFALALTIIGIVVASELKEQGAASATIFFSKHGIAAIAQLDRLENTVDPFERRKLLLDLCVNYTGLATREIHLKLNSPFSNDAKEIIMAAGDKPRKALLSDLIRLAGDDDSYLQLDAIGALASYKNYPEAKECLIKLLDSRWGAVRSMACKSISFFKFSGDELDWVMKKIEDLGPGIKHIDESIDYMVANHNLDKECNFYRYFFHPVTAGRSKTFRQTQYSVLASFLKFGSPRLSHLFELYNTGSWKDFLDDFMPDARAVDMIDKNYDAIYEYFREGRLKEIGEFSLSLINDIDFQDNPPYENLRRGLMLGKCLNISLFDEVDLLAVLYFSYSLRANHT